MLIVITPPNATPQEVARYNRLFRLGLHTLHLRLPHASREEYAACIRAIDPAFRQRVILCDHFDLGETTGTGGVHLRQEYIDQWRQWQGINRGRISVSAHSVEELQQLPFTPTYALLSPLFDSISKPNYLGTLDREACKSVLPTLPFPVLALGGITSEKYQEALSYGFYGVAVLGEFAFAGEYIEEVFLRYPQPKVLSVAGHDPSSGAGIAADIRSIEYNDAYPLSVCSTLTIQHEEEFISAIPVEENTALKHLLTQHRPAACKIGMISSLRQGVNIARTLRNKGIKHIVWDPILKATASDNALHDTIASGELKEFLSLVTLVTPNYTEAQQLFSTTDPIELSLLASEYQTYILLKGGHDTHSKNISTDLLFSPDGAMARYAVPRTPFDKHGTGCVLSATITTLLAHGYDLPSACRWAQWQTDAYRRSGNSLLGTYKPKEAIEKRSRLSACRLQYITDSLDLEVMLDKAKKALDGGIRWIQLRMKEVPSSQRLEAAFALKDLMRNYLGATLIINDDLEVALACDAHGVHLGLEDVSPTIARKVLGVNKIIGATCNTVEHIAQRALEGVDYIGIGPYKNTSTKKVLSPLLGREGVERLCQYNRSLPHPIPLFAIGGIMATDFELLAQTDIQGIALSGAINYASDPHTTSQHLLQILHSLFTR